MTSIIVYIGIECYLGQVPSTSTEKENEERERSKGGKKPFQCNDCEKVKKTNSNFRLVILDTPDH